MATPGPSASVHFLFCFSLFFISNNYSFPPIWTWFDWVLPSFPGFYGYSLGFYRVFNKFYWVLLVFPGFLPGFTGFF